MELTYSQRTDYGKQSRKGNRMHQYGGYDNRNIYGSGNGSLY